MSEFTLRNKINEAKADYINRYGTLDWRWQDEGLVWTLQDYHSSKGSVLDFTEDDWRVCKENGLTMHDVLSFCDEQWFSGDKDEIEAHTDLFIWRKEILPMVRKVYEV